MNKQDGRKLIISHNNVVLPVYLYYITSLNWVTYLLLSSKTKPDYNRTIHLFFGGMYCTRMVHYVVVVPKWGPGKKRMGYVCAGSACVETGPDPRSASQRSWSFRGGDEEDAVADDDRKMEKWPLFWSRKYISLSSINIY